MGVRTGQSQSGDFTNTTMSETSTSREGQTIESPKEHHAGQNVASNEENIKPVEVKVEVKPSKENSDPGLESQTDATEEISQDGDRDSNEKIETSNKEFDDKESICDKEETKDKDEEEKCRGDQEEKEKCDDDQVDKKENSMNDVKDKEEPEVTDDCED